MKILGELFSGKAKTVLETTDSDRLVLRFRDDTSAFDGEKMASLARKGCVNNLTNAHIMRHLEEAGVATHFLSLLSETESIVKRLDMVPVECVVRNVATGSICKRLGIEDGLDLDPPTFEFFLKNDALHDPMINDYNIRSFGWAGDDEIEIMKATTCKVNEVLKALLLDAGILLVDYGRHGDGWLLGDEFTADGCRLWDQNTREKLDKDRFRQGLGGVVEAYEAVAERLGVNLNPF